MSEATEIAQRLTDKAIMSGVYFSGKRLLLEISAAGGINRILPGYSVPEYLSDLYSKGIVDKFSSEEDSSDLIFCGNQNLIKGIIEERPNPFDNGNHGLHYGCW